MKGKCFKCGQPAAHEWRVCSDGPWRKICRDCDLQLNKIALRWAFPDDYKALYQASENKVKKAEHDKFRADLAAYTERIAKRAKKNEKVRRTD